MKIKIKKYRVAYKKGFYEFTVASLNLKPREKVFVKRSLKKLTTNN